MTTTEMWDRVRELQQLEVARLGYKAIAFIASAILVPLLLTFAYSSYYMLLEIKAEQGKAAVSLALLQERITVLQEKEKYRFDHENAQFDVTKSQVRGVGFEVKALKDEINSSKKEFIDLKKSLPTKKKVRKHVH